MSKKFYQTEWHGIQFKEFTKVSSQTLAESSFYEVFYTLFFSRYSHWEELPGDWRLEKNKIAEFIVNQINDDSQVLSVGCGLGMIEHFVKESKPNIDLFINDVASSAWKWIGSEFNEDHKFIGYLPECLPANVYFDMIYLMAVDYAMDETSLVQLLSDLKSRLKKGGKCLILSVSLEERPNTVKQKIDMFIRSIKIKIKDIYINKSVFSANQLWGWMRTREEYRLLLQAKFEKIDEGFLDIGKGKIYWISGQ